MFGAIQFAKVAGRKLGGLFKGKKGKEVLEKEVSDMGLSSEGVDIHVDDEGKVPVYTFDLVAPARDCFELESRGCACFEICVAAVSIFPPT